MTNARVREAKATKDPNFLKVGIGYMVMLRNPN